MLEKLAELERMYLDLHAKLADPQVLASPEVYRKVAKQQSDLTEVVEVYREYRKALAQIEEARQISDDSGQDGEMKEMAKEELHLLEETKVRLEERIQFLLTPKDPNDDKNVLLEIRAGTGGEEAALFAAELFRMYSRFAERHGWKVEILSRNDTGIGGLKEIIAMIEGHAAYSQLKFESGVHRVQRVPVTEAGGRIHTSAVTVAVLPEAEEVEVEIKPDELRIDVFRSSGPGGQSVNTTDSAVRITHLPTGLVVSCQDEKSQHKNKAKGLKILRARLLDLAQMEQRDKIAAERKSMVGTGDRSERIRTYNYPQNRVTDHRIGLTVHRLESMLAGEIDEFVQALTAHYRAAALKAGSGV